MISLLKGTLTNKNKNILTLMTAGGVGYDVAVAPLFAMGVKAGEDMTLFTYLKVSDSAMDLYGFQTADERSFFTLLMTVSGVGPKTAMTIMTSGTVEQLQSAIGRADISYLTGVLGLGKKTAERLSVELKSKVGNWKLEIGNSSTGVLGEVVNALGALGYTADEAREAVAGLPGDTKTTEELLRMALQKMR